MARLAQSKQLFKKNKAEIKSVESKEPSQVASTGSVAQKNDNTSTYAVSEIPKQSVPFISTVTSIAGL